MANQLNTKSFEDLIHADRQRKQNERLASQIFGKGKDINAANKNAQKINARGGSLASRVGVTKRSSSVTSTNSQRNPFSPPSRPSSAASQMKRNNKLASEIQNPTATNFVSPQARAPANGQGLSIKGTAGPFVVEAKNFAPGTTEADIEAAFQTEVIDERNINCLTSCQIISTKPQVTAELIFSEKHVADRIISKFDNLKADGRILRLRLARSGPGSLTRAVSQPISRKHDPEPVLMENTIPDATTADMEMDDMAEEVEIETDLPVSSTYENEREAADRDRRDRESRRVEPDSQDGYVSGSNGGRRGGDAEQRAARDGSRDNRSRRDDRDRERDRDRDHDRGDRERDRDRDGDRDKDYGGRRGDRPFYRGESRGEGRYQAHPNARGSHYGNGVGGGGGGGGGGAAAAAVGGGNGRGFGGFAGGSGFRGGYRGAWRGGYNNSR